MKTPLTCIPKSLPQEQWIAAARTATAENPVNNVALERLANVLDGYVLQPMHLAVLTSKYWGHGGVILTVGFLDNAPTDLRARILSHMNAWAQHANVQFAESKVEPQVRIAREQEGYWSYVGTDVLHIEPGKATMNLEGFTMDTPESEFHRVVRHETGHTLGFPHEHMREQLVARIDRKKALAYFKQTQGWSEAEVLAQVLTPLDQKTIIGTPADQTSIMCYQIPGKITKDGKPIIGGMDINLTDAEFAAKIYPRPAESVTQRLAETNGNGKPGVLSFAPGSNPDYIAAVLRAVARPG